jgi:hypothetical protein
MIEEFSKWAEKISQEIKRVSEILSRRLSDEPAALISDLQEIEAWNARMGSLLAQANSWLDKYKLVAMPSRDANRTEADRKVVLDSEVSPIRLVRDTIEHICDSIRQRLILGESILSFHKQQYAERKPIPIHKVF